MATIVLLSRARALRLVLGAVGDLRSSSFANLTSRKYFPRIHRARWDKPATEAERLESLEPPIG
jgi:hypothetical protein